MSRTKRGQRPIGLEYWGRRPISRNHGAIPGRFSKRLTHRLERLEGRRQCAGLED